VHFAEEALAGASSETRARVEVVQEAVVEGARGVGQAVVNVAESCRWFDYLEAFFDDIHQYFLRFSIQCVKDQVHKGLFERL
jgi:hypothetical protein